MQSTYDPDIATAICDLIATGESVRKACAKYKLAKSTFRDWRLANPELADRYARAREDGADEEFDLLADKRDAIIKTSRAPIPPEYIDERGKIDPAYIQWLNVQIKARQIDYDNQRWEIARKNKKYNERVIIESDDTKSLVDAFAEIAKKLPV